VLKHLLNNIEMWHEYYIYLCRKERYESYIKLIEE